MAPKLVSANGAIKVSELISRFEKLRFLARPKSTKPFLAKLLLSFLGTALFDPRKDDVTLAEDFKFNEDTGTGRSCSVMFKNEMLIFGGQYR